VRAYQLNPDLWRWARENLVAILRRVLMIGQLLTILLSVVTGALVRVKPDDSVTTTALRLDAGLFALSLVVVLYWILRTFPFSTLRDLLESYIWLAVALLVQVLAAVTGLVALIGGSTIMVAVLATAVLASAKRLRYYFSFQRYSRAAPSLLALPQ